MELTNGQVAKRQNETGTVQLGARIVRREVAELAKQDFRELARMAYEQGGARAFEDPKSSAVVHEAAHAVLYAYHGIEVRYAKVWEHKKGIQRGHWVGKVQLVERQGCETSPCTSPKEDFKNACCQIAGRAGEVLFDRDMRAASSIDELITVRMLCRNIAVKTGRDPGDVIVDVIETTADILKRNESVVREIANALDRKGVIRRAALAQILGSVKRS